MLLIPCRSPDHARYPVNAYDVSNVGASSAGRTLSGVGLTATACSASGSVAVPVSAAVVWAIAIGTEHHPQAATIQTETASLFATRIDASSPAAPSRERREPRTAAEASSTYRGVERVGRTRPALAKVCRIVSETTMP
jgi:hypothetical protein